MNKLEIGSLYVMINKFNDLMINKFWSGVVVSQIADLLRNAVTIFEERGFPLVPCPQPTIPFPLLTYVGLQPLLGWIWSSANPSVGQINSAEQWETNLAKT